MITIIAGSRDIYDMPELCRAIVESGFRITKVISGTAKGVDTMGEEWAKAHGIPIQRMPPDWEAYGRRAGLIRNEDMAKVAEAAVILWDGESRGSANMIKNAKKYKLRLHTREV